MSQRLNVNAYLMAAGSLISGGIGLLLGLLEIVAIVDPVGTKMADDADPFGDPYISPLQHAIFIILTLAFFALSIWFLRRLLTDKV